MHGHTGLQDSRRNKKAPLDEEHISILSELVLHDWSLTKAEVQKELWPHWSFRGEIAIIGEITMKSKRK